MIFALSRILERGKPGHDTDVHSNVESRGFKVKVTYIFWPSHARLTGQQARGLLRNTGLLRQFENLDNRSLSDLHPVERYSLTGDATS